MRGKNVPQCYHHVVFQLIGQSTQFLERLIQYYPTLHRIVRIVKLGIEKLGGHKTVRTYDISDVCDLDGDIQEFHMDTSVFTSTPKSVSDVPALCTKYQSRKHKFLSPNWK